MFGTPRIFSRFRIPLLALSVGAALRCSDDGVLLPESTDHLPVLMRFQGRAANEGDSALSAKRFLRLRNPKVALVWQFLGPRLLGMAFDKGSVAVSAPFEFSLDMLQPPPRQIAGTTEAVIGSFWLYADVNGNGKLDRLTHPDYIPMQMRIDTLKMLLDSAQESLREVSESAPEPVSYADTFRLDPRGNLLRLHGSDADTVATGMTADPLEEVRVYLHFRSLALLDIDGWQRFFSLRKKEWVMPTRIEPDPQGGLRYYLEDRRRLFPGPGAKAEFERRLRTLVSATTVYSATLGVSMRTAARNGWDDYPYQGFEYGGEDWVAGRSRWFSVLYFPDRKSLERLLRAERASSFRVEGIGRLRTGYNLLHCDEQYVCKVLGEADSILIDLGETGEYFDPPASSIRVPSSESGPAGSIGDVDPVRLSGDYDFYPLRPISVTVYRGELWAEIPDAGMLRFTRLRSGIYGNRPGTRFLEFVAGIDSVPAKLLYYDGPNRWVAARLGSGGRAAALGERLDSLAAIPGIKPAPAILGALPVSLESGGAALELAWNGTGFELGDSGKDGTRFRPISDSLALGLDSDEGMRLDLGPGGVLRGAWIGLSGRMAYFPRRDYIPRSPWDLFPRTDSASQPESLIEASSDDGTGSDRYVGVGLKKRYGRCSGDGRFLRPGDGLTAAIGPLQGSDSISFPSGGSALAFQINSPVQARTGISIRLCPDSSAVPARVRLLLRGAEPGQPYREFAESRWLSLPVEGAEAIWEGIPVPSGPFRIEAVLVPTADPAFLLSADGYRFGIKR